MDKSSLKQEVGLEEHGVGDILEEVLRQGAREMLRQAIENKVNEYLEKHQYDLDETATLTMVFKLAMEAQRTWKKLRGYNLIPLVLQKKVFVDGELQMAA